MSSSTQDGKFKRYSLLLRLLNLIPTILLVIVLTSIATLLLNYSITQLRSLMVGNSDIYSLTWKILDQLSKMYYAEFPDSLTIINVLMVSILMILLSWKLASYYLLATLMLSVAGCFILASLGAIEYVSMLNVLLFWFLSFSFYTANIFNNLAGWAREQTTLLVSLIIVASTLTFLAVKIDRKSREIGGKGLSEKSIVRYALVGGGLGILIGAWVFKHKAFLKDSIFLSKIVLATLATLYILSFTYLTP